MSVSAEATMKLVASQLPSSLHPNVLLVGSLAAAYHYRTQLGTDVRTKDADVVIQPAGSLSTCRDIALRLLEHGWRRTEKCFPSRTAAPTDSLRAIRLYPPRVTSYFVELLALPERRQTDSRVWSPVELDDGWYGVPSFRFMGLFEHVQQTSKEGLAYPHPAMMALANALSHPGLGTDTMSESIEGRTILRSAKDLGRVLALAWLEGPDALEEWPTLWQAALQSRFREAWRPFGRSAAAGVRALLASEDAFEQAHHTVTSGLLADKALSITALRATGERVLALAFAPLEDASS